MCVHVCVGGGGGLQCACRCARVCVCVRASGQKVQLLVDAFVEEVFQGGWVIEEWRSVEEEERILVCMYQCMCTCVYAGRSPAG